MGESIILSEAEIQQLTDYKTSIKQLQVLHRRGFNRAFINRSGSVVLERSHYEAVTRSSGTTPLVQKSVTYPFLRTGKR